MRERGIYGLVLAGGNSERMGTPKAELIYYDRPQWAYCTNLLLPFCDKIYISLEKEDQVADVPAEMQLIDDPGGKGPLGGILTALRKHPENTWLVMACDMPGIDRAIMHRLSRFRDPDVMVSCFSDQEGNIEPLLSYWESGCQDAVRTYMNKSLSPTKFIREHKHCFIGLEPQHFQKLQSINSPEERKAFLKKYAPGRDTYTEI